MDYSIVPIGIRDPDYIKGVCSLLGETFGFEVSAEQLEANTTSNSIYDSLYLAAILDNQVIGFNAFISQDLLDRDSTVEAYQSCWTATSREHRGKRIFQNVINEAKRILLERGAAFIFGFPNENSQLIFTEKLGFKEVPSLKWQVPNVPLVRDRFLSKTGSIDLPPGDVILMQNDRQLIEMKSRKYEGSIEVIEDRGNLIWGIRRERVKAGLKMTYFEIGGLSIEDRQYLGGLFREMFRRVRGVAYFQLTTTVGNTLNTVFRRLRPAKTNDLIVFDLNLDTTRNTRFNFFGGIKDVF